MRWPDSATARCRSRGAEFRESSAFPHHRRGSPSVPLTLLLPDAETKYSMARYSAFLGRRVEVQYRAGDILLPASGTLVADSGRSIFLEQQFEQHGSHKHFRWEIPYQYIVRLQEKVEAGADVVAAATIPGTEPAPDSASARSSSSGGAPVILPLQNRPKTA